MLIQHLKHVMCLLLAIYATRQSCLPVTPACFACFIEDTNTAVQLSSALNALSEGDFKLMEDIGALLPNWKPKAESQPFGFKHPWWYRDEPGYEDLRRANLNLEVLSGDAMAFFQVSPLSAQFWLFLIGAGELAIDIRVPFGPGAQGRGGGGPRPCAGPPGQQLP